ncbi:ABC transporter ATP-binding protein [Anaeromicropila herbilytica]|uniref:Multidrug ABC transporter ATP-binding protein n=1 Tax=Anaeromicropila herbilytica TaxID=2785025 RepID=A0A7R7IBQ2_9FIRM|nr:ABC transporter ATP-binding protein [Anaeromicropila herbilytica]BCN29031.1 multidrug ABC transporter ATP-binding protein [Anaeromicropila herbilytica]
MKIRLTKGTGLSTIKWILHHTKKYHKYIIIITIFGIVTSGIAILRAMAMKWLVDEAAQGNTEKVITYLSLLAGIILFDVIIKAVNTTLTARVSVSVSSTMQKDIFVSLINTRWMDFLKLHSGDYLTRLTSDVEAVNNVMVSIVPNTIALGVAFIGSFLAVLYIDMNLAFAILVILPIFTFMAKIFSRKLKMIYQKGQKIESKYRSFLNESIQNMMVIKTFCLEKMKIQTVDVIYEERLNNAIDKTNISLISSSVMTLSSWVGFFLALLWGSFGIAKGTASFGTLMALVQLIGGIQGPLSGISSSFPRVIYAMASAERLKEIEEFKKDIEGITMNTMQSAGIEFHNVSFSYRRNEPVIKNISVKINRGETVALMGPSGEGKTTLIHLILSLLVPDQGKITLEDGIESVEVNTNSRGSISYVPQGNNIFSGTIADNLRYGKEDATEEELIKASKAASAWQFISKLENGLNTVIGERGIGLSEGQAQRIAIARALLHQAPVLLLDEATSALDAQTEVAVLESIKRLEPSPTCILITHRTSALNICDRILLLENGRLNRVNISEVMKPVI